MWENFLIIYFFFPFIFSVFVNALSHYFSVKLSCLSTPLSCTFFICFLPVSLFFFPLCSCLSVSVCPTPSHVSPSLNQTDVLLPLIFQPWLWWRNDHRLHLSVKWWKSLSLKFPSRWKIKDAAGWPETVIGLILVRHLILPVCSWAKTQNRLSFLAHHHILDCQTSCKLPR